jgi:3-phosphoshikimate 1-carboxyvinyltransferase
MKPVTATVTIPGSKSYTNRALLMAAMTKGRVKIAQPLISDDTEAMINCLQTLGIEIIRHDDCIEVSSDLDAIQDQCYDLDVDLSGITIRFMIALACAVPGTQTIYGKAGLNKRPVGELVDGLRQLGAEIEYLDKEGIPPVRVTSTHLQPGTVRMDGSVSSQYFSALMMIAPLIGGDLAISVIGEQISKPYIDMTIDTMAQFGITVSNDNYKTYRIAGNQHYQATAYTVEGDVSSASYFYAIACLTGSTITTSNINPASKQADMKFLDILEKMGATVTRNKNSITVTGRGVKPMNVNMEDCPDQAMTMAVLAAFADGITVIHGVQSLRVKETERVVAVEQELDKMGIQTESTHDTLTIHGGKPRAAAIDTYGDHRMAMAFAVASTKLDGMVINNPEVVSKTFPEFWDVLATVVTSSLSGNIVLIGMRGSGKNTVGQLLANRLGRQLVDMDSLIVARTGQSVPQMVASRGWDYFRDQESTVAKQVGSQDNAIISTGGGVVLRQQNIEVLKQNGKLVLLTAEPATLTKRIEGDFNRPALTDQDSLEAELEEVWRQRRDIYNQAADITVSTQNRTPEDIANEIIRIIGARE